MNSEDKAFLKLATSVQSTPQQVVNDYMAKYGVAGRSGRRPGFGGGFDHSSETGDGIVPSSTRGSSGARGMEPGADSRLSHTSSGVKEAGSANDAESHRAAANFHSMSADASMNGNFRPNYVSHHLSAADAHTKAAEALESNHPDAGKLSEEARSYSNSPKKINPDMD